MLDERTIIIGKTTSVYRSWLFWDIMQRIFHSSWIYWLSKIGPIGCPETSVRNYHSVLRNIPEERRSHLYRAEAWNQIEFCIQSYLIDVELTAEGVELIVQVFKHVDYHHGRRCWAYWRETNDVAEQHRYVIVCFRLDCLPWKQRLSSKKSFVKSEVRRTRMRSARKPSDL